MQNSVGTKWANKCLSFSTQTTDTTPRGGTGARPVSASKFDNFFFLPRLLFSSFPPFPCLRDAWFRTLLPMPPVAYSQPSWTPLSLSERFGRCLMDKWMLFFFEPDSVRFLYHPERLRVRWRKTIIANGVTVKAVWIAGNRQDETRQERRGIAMRRSVTDIHEKRDVFSTRCTNI